VFATFVVNIAKENCIPMHDGGFGSVKGIFRKNRNQYPTAQRLSDQKNHGAVSLVEVKGLSSQRQMVDERANMIDSDIEKAAASLHARCVGSAVLAEKRKYGSRKVPRFRHRLTGKSFGGRLHFH
jgi:hypothetical protein